MNEDQVRMERELFTVFFTLVARSIRALSTDYPNLRERFLELVEQNRMKYFQENPASVQKWQILWDGLADLLQVLKDQLDIPPQHPPSES